MNAVLTIGTTRNLSSQFKRHRDETRRTRPAGEDLATAALMNSALGGNQDVEMAGSALFAPLWVQKSEKIRMDLSILKERLSKLKELHGKMLLVSFNTDDSAQAQVEALTREMQAGFKKLNAEINNMEQTPGADDAEVRQQVQRQLAKALMVLTMDFRKEETRFLNKVEANKGLVENSSLMGVLGDDSTSDLASMDPGFTQAQIAAVEVSQALAEERDREIQQIVNTIVELAQIMRDLGALVVDQGTLLDRIDYNIQQSAIKVEEGTKAIVQAEKTQKSSRMFLCIIALVVLIVVMLIVVIARNVAKNVA
jgi:syntaxin 16